MSERSGQFGAAEQGALVVACGLVLLGAGGMIGEADPGREFALTNILLAGVVLAVGALAASAYRSRSQVDIDRLEQAAKKFHENISQLSNVNKMLIEANKLGEQAKHISDAYGALKSELEQVGRHATAAAESQASINKLTSNLRDLFLKDEAGRKQMGGGAAANLMTQWELGNAQWAGDRSAKALARELFYQKLKETVLVDGELYPTPSEHGWADCLGQFTDSESDQRPGTIVEVASYQWRSASQDRTVGQAAGKKSRGVSLQAPAGPAGEAAAVASPTAALLDGVPVAEGTQAKSGESSTLHEVPSNEETKV